MPRETRKLDHFPAASATQAHEIAVLPMILLRIGYVLAEVAVEEFSHHAGLLPSPARVRRRLGSPGPAKADPRRRSRRPCRCTARPSGRERKSVGEGQRG